VGSLVVGVVTAAVLCPTTTLFVGLLAALALTHLVFTVSGWLVLWPLDAAATEHNARHEDLGTHTEEALVVAISLGALLGIGTLLVVRDSRFPVLTAVLALVGVFAAWASLHLMYAARYGHLYYVANGGSGIDFHQDLRPTYRDFLYVSHTLGMTYAVSDTDVTDPLIRSVIVRHTLISYVFGVVILASTLNLVAGVVTTG
jgi:uncharacterized membrane protein